MVVVAHSMGGLVARYWLGPLGGWRHCRGVITLGTPHRGAPKALDTLVNGVRVRGIHLQRVSDVIRSWHSPYQLLPVYRCIWDSTAGQAAYPHEVEGLGLRDGDARGVHHARKGPRAVGCHPPQRARDARATRV